ncbi:amino acid ABC transporter permease [Pimelobacter simplex]|uniref:amino acid ABC transporter permease n=1 Tax=Nocardioides simplex TaxID=2045 RepID=UPI0038048E90
MGTILSELSAGIAQTVEITLASFVVAAVLGLPLAVLRRSGSWWVRLPAVIVVEVLRAVPPIVWLFLIYYSLGSTDQVRLTTFQAAVIGLGLIYAAHLSEAYRAGLDAVPAGQWEATRALALPRAQTYARVILPQALVVVVPPMATFAIALLKDSAIASVIGATDITFHAVQLTQQDLNGLGNFTVAGLLYIALGVPFALVARAADRVLSRRLVGV